MVEGFECMDPALADALFVVSVAMLIAFAVYELCKLRLLWEEAVRNEGD